MKNKNLIKDGEFLMKLCEEYFQCKLLDKNRKINNVNARVTFGVLMRRRGYGFADIGNLIEKNHATIIHYMKQLDMYLHTDEDFNIKFTLVKRDFDRTLNNSYEPSNENVSLLYRNRGLINDIISINIEKKVLYLEIDNLKKELNRERDRTTSSTGRVQKLIDIVVQRTRLGREEETETKLNKFYNGI